MSTIATFDDLLDSFESIRKEDHPDLGQFGFDHFGFRELADGRLIAMVPTLSGNWRIVIGTGPFIDNGWCYDRLTKSTVAVLTLAGWDGDGDPLDGWHRNPFDGRRRPAGNPLEEYVAR